MHCAKCGNKVDDDARLCPSCSSVDSLSPPTPAESEQSATPARMWIPAFMMCVPLVGLAVSTQIQSRFGTDTNLARMWTVSAASLVIGLGLLGLIALGGFAARSSRTLLLALFRPGLYVTAVTITGLILSHAIILIGSIAYGESALIHRVHIGIIFTVGLGAAGGGLAVALSIFGVVRKAETIAIGKAVTRKEATILWDQTDLVAQKLGALRPDHIVIGLDPTFFLTEADVVTPGGTLTGRTLFCSLPLTRILTVEELLAIIGHELGHFRGEDTKFSEHFYPIYRGTTTALESLHIAGGEGWRRLAFLPAIGVFSFFLERFAVAENRHSRTRELLADKAGAEASSNRAMATALVKVHAFAGFWNGFQHASAKALREGYVYENASAMFAEAVWKSANRTILEGVADTHTSHPTDSHPPLAVRLAALNIGLASVASESLNVKLSQSAASLVQDAEAHEEDLSETYQLLLARSLGIE